MTGERPWPRLRVPGPGARLVLAAEYLRHINDEIGTRQGRRESGGTHRRIAVWLVVKRPVDRTDDLVTPGAADRLDPGHGRLLRGWLSRGAATDTPICRILVAGAFRFVATATVSGGRR